MSFLGIPRNSYGFLGNPKNFLGIPQKLVGIPRKSSSGLFQAIYEECPGYIRKLPGHCPGNFQKYSLDRVPG